MTEYRTESKQNRFIAHIYEVDNFLTTLKSESLSNYCRRTLICALYLKLSGCNRFAWQGFGSGGAIGVFSLRKCWKLLPRLTEAMPAGIHALDNLFSPGKKDYCTQATTAKKRRVKMSERTAQQIPRSVKK